MSTAPYSKYEFNADPGFYTYETDPKPTPKLRVIPSKSGAEVIMVGSVDECGAEKATSASEGMTTYQGADMDTCTKVYIGSLSVIGLFILFRVLYSK